MRVSQLLDIKTIKVREINIKQSEIKENFLRVKIKASGICGSDMHYFNDGGLGSFKINFPVTLGHEPSGIVIDTKSSRFSKNTRIAIEPNLPCLFYNNDKFCEPCGKGHFNLCPDSKFLGTVDFPGSFQDEILIHSSQAIEIDEKTSFEEATLLEPFSVALHAFKKCNFESGSKVAILGSGPIGICLALIANLSGASEILMIDKLDYRLDFIKDLLNCKIINEKEFMQKTKEFKSKYHYVFDAAGKKDTFLNSLNLAFSSGKVIVVGIPTYDFLEYNPHVARIKELSIINCRRSNNLLHISYDLFKKYNLPFSKIISHNYDISKIQDAFMLNSNYENNVLKTVISF
ncbi:alcohol dehydrogenase catalytic domain-containing protein [Candidatus Pelagibacter sp.]|nr:alcohol dehydrogenase catalytic domain-containing protein [Candidatus Pelagibacter sp.]MDC3349199.1 alcohol dehydrogenase catalytic domain-containing protein [Candidatus Pelagibacter sp.]